MATTLLIVEDDHLQVELLSKIIKNSDYEYKWAPSVERAKALLAAQYFSAVICDLNVEKSGDGFELLRWIRQRKGISDIPLVIMTASASADTVVKARSIGVQGFLVKPFSARGVLKILAQSVAASSRKVGVKTRIADTDSLQARMDAEVKETKAHRGQDTA